MWLIGELPDFFIPGEYFADHVNKMDDIMGTIFKEMNGRQIIDARSQAQLYPDQSNSL